MKICKSVAAVLLAGAALAAVPFGAVAFSDAEIRQQIIEESIGSYPGNCPCPYNLASNGSRCGGRSAYSRGGGYSPLCYDEDVSDAMVQRYQERHGIIGVSADGGSSPSLVRDTQQALAALGYDPGPVDGLMGRRTRIAIEQFQREAGIAMTGQLSSELLSNLTARQTQ
jgi:hypothetical protein